MESKYLYLIQLMIVFILKITSLLFGYLIIKMGYKLIREGITGKFDFKAKFKGFSADLYSMSPGLLFILLGTLLIGFTIFVDKNMKFAETLNNLPIFNFEQEIPLDSLDIN